MSLPAGALKGSRRSRPLGCVIARWTITGAGRVPLNGCPGALKESGAATPRLEVYYARLMGSTNDVAWARARRNGAPQLVLAEGQAAGAGGESALAFPLGSDSICPWFRP